jgi:hypothetical protein
LFVNTWNILSLYRAGVLKLLLEQLDGVQSGDYSPARDTLDRVGILEKRD